jgi:hypothetical protein
VSEPAAVVTERATRWRRRLPLFVAGAILSVALGVVLGSAAPPGDPPRVFVEAPDTAVAGLPLDVFVSVDVPATVRVRYADTHIEEITQDLRVSLLAEAGTWTLEVEAEDAAGRVAREERSVRAAWPPAPRITMAESLTVGDALTLRLAWHGDPARVPTLGVSDAFVELDGQRLEGLIDGDALTALVPVALQSAPGDRVVRGVVVDVFGQEHEVHGVIRVDRNPHPVQELRVAASTLAVVTPAGRDLEAETLERAFAAVGPEPRWARTFLLPLEGRATSAFGLPRRYAPGGPVSYHLGTDIAAPTGTPIHATNDGVVRVAGMYPIKGGLVVIDHGFGVTSLYFHQSALAVTEGDMVERGQVIGFVGSTGLSTGPHLHWEMRVDGVPTAPLAWVDRRWPGGPVESEEERP